MHIESYINEIITFFECKLIQSKNMIFFKKYRFLKQLNSIPQNYPFKIRFQIIDLKIENWFGTFTPFNNLITIYIPKEINNFDVHKATLIDILAHEIRHFYQKKIFLISKNKKFEDFYIKSLKKGYFNNHFEIDAYAYGFSLSKISKDKQKIITKNMTIKSRNKLYKKLYKFSNNC